MNVFEDCGSTLVRSNLVAVWVKISFDPNNISLVGIAYQERKP